MRRVLATFAWLPRIIRVATVVPFLLVPLSCATTSGLSRPPPAVLPDTAPQACRESPRGKVSLPADDGAHGNPIEWWYWTGHLKTPTGRWFGFEHVFFRGYRLGMPAKMAHHAITDIEAKQFRHAVFLRYGAYTAPEGSFDLSAGPLGAAGGGGSDRLHGEVDGYVLDLDLVAMKAPVLQHGTGYTDYPFGGNTHYYSRERMSASGTISVGGEKLPVTGTAWFDHQWGDLFAAADLGWDWIAIQLDDGREVMLFEVRDQKRIALSGGSVSDAQCRSTEVAPDSYRIRPIGTWKSPHTGCTYPMGWQVEVAGMSFTLTPVLEDQEISSGPIFYWEGAATVSGSATGRAYVELTGYCGQKVTSQ